jgi:hypothetical protein
MSNFPDDRVLAGDLAAVVDVYPAPDQAYEGEFVNPRQVRTFSVRVRSKRFSAGPVRVLR